MFGIRTPINKRTAPPSRDASPDVTATASLARTNVRRSIEALLTSQTPSSDAVPAAPTKPKKVTQVKSASPPSALQKPGETAENSETSAPTSVSRVQQAKNWVTKAKIALNQSRNLRTDIKEDVTQALDCLYRMVRDGEKERGNCPPKQTGPPLSVDAVPVPAEPRSEEFSRLISSLVDHSKLVRDSTERMEELKDTLAKHTTALGSTTYAGVVAGSKPLPAPPRQTLHSVVVASNDKQETGEQVLEKIRTTINAKEGGFCIDRIRKAKDSKVIISCRDEGERSKVREKLKTAGQQLVVEDAQNLDPLIILRDVLSYNTDEDVMTALRKQNTSLFTSLAAEDDRIEIRFRKRARNNLMSHVVARVSPTLWRRLTEASAVYIDMQRIRVEDQSPLVQCSMCLGYGHGRRLCTEKVVVCSHCGDSHLRADCPSSSAGAAPQCRNCRVVKNSNVDHNAFSSECPVRRKWDALARAAIAYC